jgi:hypothetical protein
MARSGMVGTHKIFNAYEGLEVVYFTVEPALWRGYSGLLSLHFGYFPPENRTRS